MLVDIERKILRILYNYSAGRYRMPSMEELMIKTGKNKKVVVRALINLEDKLNIQWDNKRLVESIRILQGWEQESKPAKPSGGNIDYWTHY